MIYSISNTLLEVQISTTGAELMSVKSKLDGTEYLWQGDKTYWGGRAYNLFPICGRLTEGKYTYGGKEYTMNLHGFARKSEFEAFKVDENEIAFFLADSDETLKVYPFRFAYKILYTLIGNELNIEISVENKDNKNMYFALGGHPGFNVPLANGKFEDYYLEFSEECTPDAIYMSDTCYTTRVSNSFPLEGGKRLPLKHSLFDRDAIVLEKICNNVTLKSSADNKTVTVKTPPCMKYLGIWHAPNTEAPYVCIEPWTSLPAYENEVDELTVKRDMFKIAPAETYDLKWSILLGL